MSQLSLENEKKLYVVGLYALLHDVGKPILRFARRYIQKLELGAIADDAVKAVENQFNMNIMEIAKMRHEEISKMLINNLLGIALSSRDEEYVNMVITLTDRLAASERGLAPEVKEFVENVYREIEQGVTTDAKLSIAYSHETSPLLTPTWMLLKTDYLKHVGLSAYVANISGRWSGSNERKRLATNFFYQVYQAVLRKDKAKLVEFLVSLLRELAEKELWVPIEPLFPHTIANLNAIKLADAMGMTSYSKVVLLLLDMLRTAKNIFGGSITRGFIDTVSSILKTTTSLVPSAVYWSMVPDISLYSHSKLVAAYTLSSQLSSRLRILVIDANSIQAFIAAPVKATAASRVIRGRSILVELALDTLIEYALTLFGKLPMTNVVVSEGGTVDIFVPDLPDFNERLDKLRKTAHNLAQYLGGVIGFTIAYSDPLELSDISFEKAIKALAEGSGEKTFAEVLDNLSSNLAIEKSKAGCRPELIQVEGVIAKEDEIQGFDSITQEPVLKNNDKDPYRLVVDEKTKAYVDIIAAEKLSLGDVVATPTHMSLVIGTVARELIDILSIHVYRRIGNVVKPDSESIEKIREALLKHCKEARELLCRLTVNEKFESNIALVPLSPAGALYLLISIPLRKEIHDVEDLELLRATYEVIHAVLKAISNVLTDLASEDRDVRVWIRLVNASHAFIFTNSLKLFYNNIGEEVLEDVAQAYSSIGNDVNKLISKGVDIAFGFMFTGLYHPAVLHVEKGVKGFKLIDLDEFGVIAVAKMDFDMFGEVRALYAISPSRLVTLSDFVNIVVAGKAYLKAVDKAKQLLGKGMNIDVIPLYAGGDDVTIYGKWSHVVYYMDELYNNIKTVLKPLTASIAIAIDDCTAPLLLLYNHAVELLEGHAKKVKASCTIGAPYTILYPKPQLQAGQEIYKDEKYLRCTVVPLEKPSIFYPWIIDPAANWNLRLLAKLIDPLDYVSDKSLLKKLEEYKRELYILTTIAHEFGKAVEAQMRLDVVLPIEILYAYAWSRRKYELNDLKKLLEEEVDDENKGLKLLAYPDDIVGKSSVEEALRILLASKPILDLVLLALRRPDTVKPSRIYSESG